MIMPQHQSASGGFLKSWRLFALFSGLLLSCSLTAGNAQTQALNLSKKKLDAVVSLRCGQTTLETVMRVLSEQTGVKCAVSDYLKDHKLLMQMENLSGTDVLDTLAELYGWRWFVDEQGNVVLTHQRVRAPQKLDEIAVSIQAAVPKDMQRFLRIHDPAIKSAATVDNKIDVAILMKNSASRTELEHRIEESAQKQVQLLQQTMDSNAYAAKPTTLPVKPLPLSYKTLTPSMQQMLLKALVLSALHSATSSLRAFNLLHNALLPYQRDMGSAEISVKEGGIDVGTSTQTSEGSASVGFGEGLSQKNPTPHAPN